MSWHESPESSFAPFTTTTASACAGPPGAPAPVIVATTPTTLPGSLPSKEKFVEAGCSPLQHRLLPDRRLVPVMAMLPRQLNFLTAEAIAAAILIDGKTSSPLDQGFGGVSGSLVVM